MDNFQNVLNGAIVKAVQIHQYVRLCVVWWCNGIDSGHKVCRLLEWYFLQTGCHSWSKWQCKITVICYFLCKWETQQCVDYLWIWVFYKHIVILAMLTVIMIHGHLYRFALAICSGRSDHPPSSTDTSMNWLQCSNTQQHHKASIYHHHHHLQYIKR